jgi:hypothetical protein
MIEIVISQMDNFLFCMNHLPVLRLIIIMTLTFSSYQREPISNKHVEIAWELLKN